MKRATLLLALILMSYSMLAQKLQKPKIDKITGDTSWVTSVEKIYGKPSFSGTVGEQLFASVGKFKDITLLMFSIQTAKASLFSVDEGQKIYIKLKNDSIVSLINSNSSISKYSTISYGSNSNCFYQVTNQDIDNLAVSDVQFIRIEYSDGTFEYVIKDKFSDVIKTLVLLIKQK